MATVTDIKTAKPRVESITVELTQSDARDVQTYIKKYYQANGYGAGYEKNVGLYKILTDALEGKKTAAYAF